MAELSAEAKAKLFELKKDYAANMPKKAARLKICWQKNDLDDLRKQSHKIAGSSSSFEFPDVSFAAKTLEALCRTRLEHSGLKITSLEGDKTLLNAYQVLLESLSKHSKD